MFRIWLGSVVRVSISVSIIMLNAYVQSTHW